MAKNSGGTRNAPNGAIPFPRYAFGENGPRQIGKTETIRILVSQGYNADTINEAFKLIDKHGDNEAMQQVADAQIIQEIDNKTPLGNTLIGMAKLNEAQYKEWMKMRTQFLEAKKRDLKSDLDFYGSSYLGYNASDIDSLANQAIPKDIKVYRGGGRKRLEAWTTDEQGAHTGNGMRIRIDHRSTMKEMLKTHYVLGGISYMSGAPGESEVTFIRKKK